MGCICCSYTTIINRSSRCVAYRENREYLYHIESGGVKQLYLMSPGICLFANGKGWRPYALNMPGEFGLDKQTKVTISRNATDGYVVLIENKETKK